MPAGVTVAPTAWRSSDAGRAVVLGSPGCTARLLAQSRTARATALSSPQTDGQRRSRGMFMSKRFLLGAATSTPPGPVPPERRNRTAPARNHDGAGAEPAAANLDPERGRGGRTGKVGGDHESRPRRAGDLRRRSAQ